MYLPLGGSSAGTSGLAATAIAISFILFASTVTITNAQQQEQLTSEPSAMELRTIAENSKDSFRVQVPQGWTIHDVNNTGSALIEEVVDGVGILAQLCPEEEQQLAAFPNAGGNTSISGNNSNNNTSCRGAQEEVIHVVRYPNMGSRLGFASDDVIDDDGVTPDFILGYQMQKLQEVGYRDIRIVDSTDTTVNVDISTGFNNTIAATVPAKLVEMTYSTNLAPDQIRKGYFISTATNATPRNLGNITGYGIFYEGASSTAAEGGEETMLPSAGGLILPLPVMEIFDSFELIATAEVVQSTAQETQAAEEAQSAEEELADPLTAEIDSNDTEGIAPTTFEFEADIAGGTEPYTIRWDLDDDGIVESNEETVVATFSEAGTYNVTLTITDSEDQIASDSVEITVEEAPVENSSTVEQPATEETQETACDPSYPDICIPPPPQNLT